MGGHDGPERDKARREKEEHRRPGWIDTSVSLVPSFLFQVSSLHSLSSCRPRSPAMGLMFTGFSIQSEEDDSLP